MKQNETQKTQKNAKRPKTPSTYVCIKCKKIFKSRTTLWRHGKKCLTNVKNEHYNDVEDQKAPVLKNKMIVDKLIQIVEVQKTNQELTNQLVQQQVDILEKFAASQITPHDAIKRQNWQFTNASTYSLFFGTVT